MGDLIGLQHGHMPFPLTSSLHFPKLAHYSGLGAPPQDQKQFICCIPRPVNRKAKRYDPVNKIPLPLCPQPPTPAFPDLACLTHDHCTLSCWFGQTSTSLQACSPRAACTTRTTARQTRCGTTSTTQWTRCSTLKQPSVCLYTTSPSQHALGFKSCCVECRRRLSLIC